MNLPTFPCRKFMADRMAVSITEKTSFICECRNQKSSRTDRDDSLQLPIRIFGNDLKIKKFPKNFRECIVTFARASPRYSQGGWGWLCSLQAVAEDGEMPGDRLRRDVAPAASQSRSFRGDLRPGRLDQSEINRNGWAEVNKKCRTSQTKRSRSCLLNCGRGSLTFMFSKCR